MTHLTSEMSHWINEREAVRMRRAQGLPAPWTTDPVIATVRFCNVHREDDKVTRHIRNSGVFSSADIPVWRVVLARMVNRISTLEAIKGFVERDDLLSVKAALKNMRAKGPIWGNAYTISTCGKTMDKVDYVIDHVVQTVKDVERDFPFKFNKLSTTFLQLTDIDGLGSFLAGQVIADLKNTPCHALNLAPDWHTWSSHGPGSLRGLTRYFGNSITPAHYQEAIAICYAEVIPLVMPYVGRIHMQDFQNCLCEFDKWCRATHNTGKVRNKYEAK